MLKKIILRPVFATVISIILVLLGLLGLYNLPLTQFPEIAPPQVSVQAFYPGGNAEVVMRSVIVPMEQAINGVENMTFMTSSAGNDGSASINVSFRQGTNPDQAAVNVQNRVQQVVSFLPPEVVQAGIQTSKQSNGFIMFVEFSSQSQDAYDQNFLENYVLINVLPELKRIPGIGNTFQFGGADYAIRIWLNPQSLSNYGLAPKDVLSAIQDQSLEAAPGNFGENSKESYEYTIRYRGKFNTADQFENIVVRSNPDGSTLHLKDLARVEFGAASYASECKSDGRPATGLGISQISGSNANEIIIAIQKSLDQLSRAFPKGITYNVVFSVKTQLDDSIKKVKMTLLESFFLVFLVVFVFLGDLKSTLIPAIAVPVSLIGTFFFMNLMGFSLNMLTLFAMILAIGIVVDDAIVVVEAVHTKMDRTGLPAREATISTMAEITNAIISITLVMAAVFFPTSFMSGATGIFYKQFAFTLATAISISALNALTLSPALCALLLRNKHSGVPKDDIRRTKNFRARFLSGFHAGFQSLTNRYLSTVGFLLKRPWVGLSGLALCGLISIFLMRTTPKGFVPDEDNNFIVYGLSLPPGASLDRTTKALNKLIELTRNEPAINTTFTVSGIGGGSFAQGSSYAVGFLNLKPIKERGKMSDINELQSHFREKFAPVKDGDVFVFTFPTLQGFGFFSGVQFVLQDHTGGDIEKFSDVADKFIDDLSKEKSVEYARTDFKINFPQLDLQVDYAKAKQLGVSVRDLMGTMSAYFGSTQATDFNRFGKYYRVYMQADVPYRKEPAVLDDIFVKNDKGEMVPVSAVVSLRHVYGPQSINRYNLFNSIEIEVQPAKGHSTGEAMQTVEDLAARKLPLGFGYEWESLSREEKQSGGQMFWIFSISLVFVYLLLSALYESYLLPLAVMLSIPTGIIGVFLAIRVAGLDNNIYVQVGLIMLIGLLAKNAILIVEFAVQRRRAGQTLVNAALEGAGLRLRPILMTSFAFIAGLIPLMYAKGSSASGNHAISVGTAGGMLTGVLLGIFIVPVLFVLFQGLQEQITTQRHPATENL